MDDQEQLPQPESGAQPAAVRRSRIYYGWLVAAAAMIISAAAVGVRDIFQSSPIPFTDGFKVGPDVTSYTRLSGVLIGAFTQPILGYLFDMYDSRKVILINVAVAGVAAVIFTVMPWLLAGALLYSVVVSAAGGASFGLLGPLAARWFLKRRTLVLALLLSVPTVGNIFLSATTAYLTGAYGWRLAWLALGPIFLFLALPVGLKFLRNWPSEMGLRADGEPESPVEASMRGDAPVTAHGRFEVVNWRRAFRTPAIWILLPVFAIGGFAVDAGSTFFLWFAVVSGGITPGMAGILTPVMTLLGVMGALAGWWLAERFSRKKVLGCLLLAQGFAFPALISVPTPAGLWLFAVLAGLSGTAWMLLAFLLIADIYGLRALGTLWGLAFLFHTVGNSIGPNMAALAIDLTGSYVLPIAAWASMVILASVMAFAVDERRYSARYQAAAGGEVV